jgi:hypothetical protein
MQQDKLASLLLLLLEAQKVARARKAKVEVRAVPRVAKAKPGV